MSRTRVGVIGAGVIGLVHLKALAGAKDQLETVGLTDMRADAAANCAKQFEVPAFADHRELIQRARPDYVVICTPHHSHTDIAIEAMKLGANVLLEKPMAVHAAKARECIAVAHSTGKRIGVGYCRRPKPIYRKMKDLMDAGLVGDVIRVTMVCTAWYRTMAYYRSGGWRASWEGEGGGILVNQAPHDLDFLLWLMGQPAEVLAEVETRWHQIEVEDVVNALLKWPSGATGTLQVNTAEATGRTTLEIAGTRGTLLLNDTALKVIRLGGDSRRHSDTTKDIGTPPATEEVLTYELPDPENRFLLEHLNFAAYLRGEAELMCSAEEGLAEVELANGLLVSGILRQWVKLPAPPELFDRTMARLGQVRKIEMTRKEYARV